MNMWAHEKQNMMDYGDYINHKSVAEIDAEDAKVVQVD